MPTEPPAPAGPPPQAPPPQVPAPRAETPTKQLPTPLVPRTQPDIAQTQHFAPAVPPPKRRFGLWLGVAALVLIAGGVAFALSGPSRPRGGLVEAEPTKLEPVRIRLSESDPPPPRGVEVVPVAARPAPTPVAELDAMPEGDAPKKVGPTPSPRPTATKTRPAPSKTRPKSRSTRRPRRSARKPAMGFLNVGAKPWAEIQIDGKRWPHQTPQAGIKLRAGKHQVTLHNPQTGVTRSTAVYIKAGAYRTVMMDMRKNR